MRCAKCNFTFCIGGVHFFLFVLFVYILLRFVWHECAPLSSEIEKYRTIKDKLSLDVNDFDVSFARGLSLEDGSKTLTEFTASIIGESLSTVLLDKKKYVKKIIICGGGRKNKTLINKIKQNLPSSIKIKSIDEYNIDGDYVESKAFAFMAVRTYKKLPISFPNTTKCKIPCIGGKVIEN